MEVIDVEGESFPRASDDRAPDLRAVHGPLGLNVRGWSSELRWSDLDARPLDFDEAFVGPEGLAVFELWERPGGWFARPIGDASLDDRVARQRLRSWAGGREVQLGPVLPERLSPPEPLEVAFRLTSEPPAFRFVHHRGRGGLCVHPWGRGAEAAVAELREPWPGALGDIVALDAERAEATFARVPGPVRARTESLLRRWAADDGWALAIRGDVAPSVRLRLGAPLSPGGLPAHSLRRVRRAAGVARTAARAA
jgi:hypothetical protein